MTYVTSSLLVQKVRKLSTSASKANIAETSAKVAKMARNLAIAHIVIGFLLIFFGIGDRLVEFHKFCSWTGGAYFGIWIGMLVHEPGGVNGTTWGGTKSGIRFWKAFYP